MCVCVWCVGVGVWCGWVGVGECVVGVCVWVGGGGWGGVPENVW